MLFELIKLCEEAVQVSVGAAHLQAVLSVVHLQDSHSNSEAFLHIFLWLVEHLIFDFVFVRRDGERVALLRQILVHRGEQVVGGLVREQLRVFLGCFHPGLQFPLEFSFFSLKVHLSSGVALGLAVRLNLSFALLALLLLGLSLSVKLRI